MAKYRLTKGSHSAQTGGKDGERVEYHAGVKGQDIIELTDAQANLPHLRKRIEKVHGEDVGTSAGSRESPNRPSSSSSAPLALTPDDDDGDTDSEGDLDPKIAAVLSGNVDQVLTYINDHEDDTETLEALREAELEGKARKGVLDAINDLLGE